jgi:hypothetical protein
MILGPNGRKIRQPVQKKARAVIFVSENGENWTPISPETVPEWLQEPYTMGLMMAGEVLEDIDGQKLYKAQAVPDAV